MLLPILVFATVFNPPTNLAFTNIQEARGSLYIGIYKSEADFLKPEKACLKKTIPVTSTGNLDLDVSELAPGTYAISCFHDLNDNGKLDTNFMGIPSEPYGFSNNARPKFRAPKWSEAKFELKAAGGQISIRLENW
jgi:uncharacterized protein (DUF2141 family)